MREPTGTPNMGPRTEAATRLAPRGGPIEKLPDS